MKQNKLAVSETAVTIIVASISIVVNSLISLAYVVNIICYRYLDFFSDLIGTLTFASIVAAEIGTIYAIVQFIRANTNKSNIVKLQLRTKTILALSLINLELIILGLFSGFPALAILFCLTAIALSLLYKLIIENNMNELRQLINKKKAKE